MPGAIRAGGKMTRSAVSSRASSASRPPRAPDRLPPRRSARRIVGRRSWLASHADHGVTQESRPSLTRLLTVPNAVAGPLGDIGLGQATEVGQLDGFALDGGEGRQCGRDGRAIESAEHLLPASSTISARGSGASGSSSSTVGRRRRTASMARWCTIDSTRLGGRHARSRYRSALRQTPETSERRPRRGRAAGYPCCQSKSHACHHRCECLDGRGVQAPDAGHELLVSRHRVPSSGAPTRRTLPSPCATGEPFGLELGIEIDGKRVNLLPALVALLERSSGVDDSPAVRVLSGHRQVARPHALVERPVVATIVLEARLLVTRTMATTVEADRDWNVEEDRPIRHRAARRHRRQGAQCERTPAIALVGSVGRHHLSQITNSPRSSAGRMTVAELGPRGVESSASTAPGAACRCPGIARIASPVASPGSRTRSG